MYRVKAAGKQIAAAGKRGLRRRGWELHRTDPARSLGEHLWYLFPYLGINCVLDVGARFGEYGEFLRQNGYMGRIASFEPVEASYQMLANRCARDPRWRVYRHALGSKSTTSEINVSTASSFSSFLRPTAQSVACVTGTTVERKEMVEIYRLDEVFDEVVADLADPRVYLKMDTQGWDLEVLRGASGRLETILALQSEMSVHPLYEGATDFREAISEFNRAGFAVTGFFNLPHHQEFRMSEFDCVMIRTPASQCPAVRRW